MADDPHIGALVGARLGKYDILGLLAVGGSAEVYLARSGGEGGFEKFVVIKRLLDRFADESEYVSMFLDEARLCGQLEHANIVQTIDFGNDEGRYYLIMEHLAGTSLARLARLARELLHGETLPAEISLALMSQAAAGLHYAHEKTDADGASLGVVHRDVSPQNLVLTFEGIVKVLDFGIAMAKDRQTDTRTGTVKGKYAYMSPEQTQAHEVSRTSDVFSLGVVAHELLTGQRLFKRATEYETCAAITAGNYPTPSSINPRLDSRVDDVVMAALAYAPSERYSTAEAFEMSVREYLYDRGAPIGPADVAEFTERHFARVIAAHAKQMQLLIEGRLEPVALRDDAADGEGATYLDAFPLLLAGREDDSADTAQELPVLGRNRESDERTTPLEGVEAAADVPDASSAVNAVNTASSSPRGTGKQRRRADTDEHETLRRSRPLSLDGGDEFVAPQVTEPALSRVAEPAVGVEGEFDNSDDEKTSLRPFAAPVKGAGPFSTMQVRAVAPPRRLFDYKKIAQRPLFLPAVIMISMAIGVALTLLVTRL